MKKFFLGCFFMVFCFTVSFAQEKDSFEVYFDFNKSVIKSDASGQIDGFLDTAKVRIINLRLNGHTDWIGTQRYNMGLSERRAKSALDFLLEKGISEDKLELFYFGKKNPKYSNRTRDGRDKNRRVNFSVTLEDPDVDTTIVSNCAEVFVPKKTFKPNRNRKIDFKLTSLSTANAVSSAGIVMEDTKGRKLFANGIMHFSATANGKELQAGQTLKVKMPAVGKAEAGMTLYKGVSKNGKTVWENTGKSCAGTEKNMNCETYNFDWENTGYCACAMPRPCEEDCNTDPFGGERKPNLKDADIKFSGKGTVIRFKDGTYNKDIKDLNITLVDDDKKSYDLTLCQYFTYGVTSDEVFPLWYTAKTKKNIIVVAKDGGNDAKSLSNKMTKIYVPNSMLEGVGNPIAIPGTTPTDFIKWDAEKFESSKCLGTVDCDYTIFEVPATGNYKIADYTGAKKPTPAKKATLKIRVYKNSIVYVGNKKSNYVYRASNSKKGTKTKTKEYNILEFDNPSDIVIYVQHTKKSGKKYFQEAALSDLKYKKSKEMYIMRKRDFDKIDDFSKVELSKCK